MNIWKNQNGCPTIAIEFQVHVTSRGLISREPAWAKSRQIIKRAEHKWYLIQMSIFIFKTLTTRKTRIDGMKRGRWARWLATLRKVHQKNKLTTATAFFYKLQKDSSISNYFHSSNLIPLTTQNKKINYLVVKDTESFQTKLQSSEDF